jgi:hypothetical protein
VKQSVRRSRRRAWAKLTRELAGARPTRLDPAVPPTVSWPPASHFAQLPSRPAATSQSRASFTANGNRQASRPEGRVPQARPSGPSPLRRKLLAAVSSVVAISTALTIAVLIGGSHVQRPGQSATSGHDQRRGTGPGDTRMRFRQLPLIRPWRGHVEYGIRGGIVYLAGFAAVHADSGTAITVLPQSIRPRAKLDLPVATNPLAVITIQITPDGVVRTLALPKGLHVSRIWLSGVSFPEGS